MTIFIDDMLTAHTIKQIQSLDKKKFRQKYDLFIVEGNKIISELENSAFKVEKIFTTTPDFFSQSPFSITTITEQQLRKISHLQNPKDSLALCQLLPLSEIVDTAINLVLDNIQDPGNLGTIIRLADWFGIEQIICSKETVDVYNPKVIQATMGSFTRMNMVYTDLEDFFSKNTLPTFGTDMQGTSIYSKHFPEKMNLIMGNEGNGICASTERFIDEMLTIPRFGKKQSTESLNVSMATGIILGEIFSNR
ncbi:hypothetical protein HMPREF9699_00912 [Bergeyella zoohelcum ATCC 43767]|uniref:Uncharacterized protein n=2 Tax=Bergeyella zoohelcum TaxID=1015 RepID=K1LRE3_9FLAO|nr:hypothetical protein HMPREF9699_00912 [Bergeyella zoohelcum ATCC 43767]SUV48903.1 23S rRNA (guanosine-2'-O-)-methyltransferase RlmB [Bergeyella zoohelcum]